MATKEVVGLEPATRRGSGDATAQRKCAAGPSPIALSEAVQALSQDLHRYSQVRPSIVEPEMHQGWLADGFLLDTTVQID